MYIMRGHEHRAETPKSFFGRFQRGFERKFEDFRRGYEALLETTLEHRGMFVACFLAFCVLSLGLVHLSGPGFLSAGRRRPAPLARSRDAPDCAWKRPPGSATRSKPCCARRFLADQLQTVLDNIGLPNSGINQSYSSSGTIGTSDAEILIALDPEHHPPTADLRRHLREVFAADDFRAWNSSSSPPISLRRS